MKQTDRQTESQRDRQRDRHTDRQTRTDRQTDGQTDLMLYLINRYNYNLKEISTGKMKKSFMYKQGNQNQTEIKCLFLSHSGVQQTPADI